MQKEYSLVKRLNISKNRDGYHDAPLYQELDMYENDRHDNKELIMPILQLDMSNKS